LDCCVAIDSIMDGLEKDDATMYQEELVPRLNKLLTENHSKMKLCAVAAIGSIAEAAEEGFLPYFKDAMNSLGPYMNQKEDTEDLNIRRIVTDAMGRIAVAVGPEAFRPYVAPLMQASEEALQLQDEELRESSYILWSYMVKVYGEGFEPFLEGVVKGLFVCLDQEEESMTLDADSEEALERIVARISGNKKLSDKKLKDVDISELLVAKGAEIETIDVEDDDDMESIGLGPATAISMEKEIAVGVMGDVLAHSKAKFLPYFEKTVEMMVTMAHHPYHGVRQAAVETLLRAYESLWQIETDKGMEKWKPGIPLKVQPTADLTQLGTVVMEATLDMWEDQDERYVAFLLATFYPDDTLGITQLTQTHRGC
jgi:importin-4